MSLVQGIERFAPPCAYGGSCLDMRKQCIGTDEGGKSV